MANFLIFSFYQLHITVTIKNGKYDFEYTNVEATFVRWKPLADINDTADPDFSIGVAMSFAFYGYDAVF